MDSGRASYEKNPARSSRQKYYHRRMQIVGRECDLCRARLKSEVGAIGCERREIAFHTACLKAGGPATYRDASVKKPKGAPLLCPTCHDDLRARKRERDALRDELHARAEIEREARSEADKRRAYMTRLALGILISIVLTVIRLAMRHR